MLVTVLPSQPQVLPKNKLCKNECNKVTWGYENSPVRIVEMVMFAYIDIHVFSEPGYPPPGQAPPMQGKQIFSVILICIHCIHSVEFL